jgi:hypothetical protein
MGDATCGRGILLMDVSDNRRKISGGFRRPLDLHFDQLRTKDSVHLPAHVLMTDGSALIKRGESFANLFLEPLVVVKIARNQLAHYLIRPFTSVRGDPV